MEKEGLNPYLAVMEKNEFTGVHEHKYDETRILVSGSVELCAEGRRFILKQGDRIDINKNTPHTAKNLEKGQSVMLCAKKGERVTLEVY